ncbi:MAG TPA: hypothetical protein VFD32_16355 [Dehalococcoidia bacterium]|nr:hypothetical protein [Dehalococcoidia bacterium]
MLPLLMRVLALLAAAFVVMGASALFLYLFFGTPFAQGFAAGAIVGVAAAGLCAWLLWLLETEDGRAPTNRHHS